MGQRGPKPGSGGRPKKPIADKITDGNPGKRPLTVIDFKDSAADLEGQPMPKPSEFLSAKQKDGSTLCAAEIYENVWKEEGFGAENIIAVHIRHIREKIEINPKDPKYLKVIWGVGYKIENIV